MPRYPRLKVVAALATLHLLGGCIAAAAAIPILAGGGLVGGRVIGNGTRADAPERSIPRPPFDTPAATPDITPAPALATPAFIANAETAAQAPAAQMPVSQTQISETRAPETIAASSGLRPPAAARAYDGFVDYVTAKSQPPKVGEKRKSALLADPGTLKPETTRCTGSQPAILIDLDPGDELLDTAAEFAPNAPLAGVLAELRERNVSVHWLSGNSAAEAGTLRKRLAESGLDPQGRDELVLMRYPDDRKQVRRNAVGATHCLIAIAGDERRDFDELYAYLKSPDRAIALESLVGNGWFLVPPALNSKDN